VISTVLLAIRSFVDEIPALFEVNQKVLFDFGAFVLANRCFLRQLSKMKFLSYLSRLLFCGFQIFLYDLWLNYLCSCYY